MLSRLGLFNFMYSKLNWEELKDNKITTILVTHDSDEAMFMSDYIAVLRDGTLEQFGTPFDIYMRPRSKFVSEFFSEINVYAPYACLLMLPYHVNLPIPLRIEIHIMLTKQLQPMKLYSGIARLLVDVH